MFAMEKREQVPLLWSWPWWLRLAWGIDVSSLLGISSSQFSIGTLCTAGMSPVKQGCQYLICSDMDTYIQLNLVH